MNHLRSVICFTFISIRIFFTADIQSQDTSIIKYLPLQVGNVWIYYGSYGSPLGQSTYFDKYYILSTYQFSNKTYFKIKHVRVMLTGTYTGMMVGLFNDSAALRLDSINLNIYRNNICNSRPELLVDSLLSRKRDSANTCDFHGTRVICNDTSNYKIFGMNKKSKSFSIYAFEGYNEQKYAKDIGVVSYIWSQHGEGFQYHLRGCIINGIIYGDTSLTGINKISSEVPQSYKLFQNYPNPFNPTTKIKFSLPAPSKGGVQNVKLKVYDVMGREVQTLVNEQLQPGTYEVEWPAPTGDGSNYSSGVYYYTLISNSFTETKRMALIK